MKSPINLAFRRVALFAAFCLLAAYPASRMGLFEWPRAYDPLALPDLAQSPNFLTKWQMKIIDYQPADCALALQRVGISAQLNPTKNPGTDCEITSAFTATQFSTAKIKPEDMRCALAARLYQWERHALQPAARRILGEEIAEITHFGSFSCRTMRGKWAMSEHATANAFDISGFRTKSGKLISVKRDWGKPTQEAKLLTVARDSLCDWFNVTLSADYNKDHADHFHIDMGLWRTCR
jgi:hypothetical protein